MKNRPLITVIIPCYNDPHLFESIDSVLVQQYPAIELIVADDGSAENRRDEVLSYVQQHQHGNIASVQYRRSETNQGTVQNINQAIAHSSGDPIFTLASDDVLYDEKVLEDWVRAFEESNAHVVVGWRSVCDETLSREYHLAPTGKQLRLLRQGNPKKIWKELCRDNFLFGCATARSRKCVEEYGAVPSCYRLIEDYPMNLRWYRMGARVMFMERTVVKHRKGGTSAANNVSDVYHQDTREIYRQEVFPYVRFPFLWNIHMNKRICQRNRERDYLLMRRKNPSFAWNVLCHLRYPEIIVKYIKSHYRMHDSSQ